MKKLVYGIIALLALGCNSTPSTNTASNTASSSAEKTASLLTSSTSSLYAVPLAEAVDNISRYNKNIKIYDSLIAVAEGKKPDHKVPLKGFTIRAADLFEAMGLPVADTVNATYKAIRVYLGYSHKHEFKMYLTPVEGANLGANPPVAGKDIILKGPFFKLGGDGDYVLDFTQPCTATCPDNSHLTLN